MASSDSREGSNGLARRAQGVPVLVASPRERDFRDFAMVLQDSPWIPVRVSQWKDALKLFGSIVIPVLICDCELPGLDLPAGFTSLRRILRAPAVILLSDFPNPAIPAEFARRGACDVLFRPFPKPHLLAVLELAYIKWQAGMRERRGVYEASGGEG